MSIVLARRQVSRAEPPMPPCRRAAVLVVLAPKLLSCRTSLLRSFSIIFIRLLQTSEHPGIDAAPQYGLISKTSDTVTRLLEKAHYAAIAM